MILHFRQYKMAVLCSQQLLEIAREQYRFIGEATKR